MALTKPPVLPAWAEAGDKVQPSNAEIQAGWPLSNVPPSRQRFNWLQNFLANGVRYLTRRGMPDYGADETYMIGDRVIGDDGKTYRSLQDNNINHAPSASPLWWEEWAPSLSRLADLLQKQTYTAFTTAGAAPNFTLTPTPAITAYAAGQRFRVKVHATGTTGSNTLNISGLGAKNLMQYDPIGTKVPGVVINGQLFDAEYDGADFVILDSLPSSSGVTPPQFDNDTSLATTEFVQRAAGNRRGFVAYDASRNLSAADAGMYIAFNGTDPCSAVLPDPATFPAGTSFLIEAASRDVTVTATNATFDGPAAKTQNVASILLSGASGNICCEFIVQEGGRYRAIGGEGISSVPSGYVKFSNGLIMQWGQVYVASGSTANSTLPIAFPNAAVAGFVTLFGAPVGSSYSGSINSMSTTQVQVGHWASGGAGASYRYLVIGH